MAVTFILPVEFGVKLIEGGGMNSRIVDVKGVPSLFDICHLPSLQSVCRLQPQTEFALHSPQLIFNEVMFLTEKKKKPAVSEMFFARLETETK